jgi:hypothetical protein
MNVRAFWQFVLARLKFGCLKICQQIFKQPKLLKA